jgi:carboxynorspermidine decarboxylase
MSRYLNQIKTPAYVLFEEQLEQNLRLFSDIKKKTGCKIILALKAFSNYSVFPLISSYIDGVTASSLHEARLGFEEFKKETHIYSPAYKQTEIQEIAGYVSHVVFNSFEQLKKLKHHLPPTTQLAVRLNPEHSEVAQAIYNPCAKYSRFGLTEKMLKNTDIEYVDGFMVHALCGNDSFALERLITSIETKFSDILHKVSWFDFGGGHMITDPTYNRNHLCEIINRFQDKYQLQVVLEPGESLVSNVGVLVSSVLDIVDNEIKIAILDTSASAHMPDVLEMPYRPDVENSGKPGEHENTYKLGSITCLSGDLIGDYSFKHPLEIGDKIIFRDMAQYTTVKNTTFNGISLPSISVVRKNGTLDLVNEFTYNTFKERL